MVLGSGRAHEHGGALAVVGEHLEAERLFVERGGPAGVAHVEDRVIEPAYGSTHAVRNPLSRSTIPGNTSTKRATSAGCDDQPTEIRNECSASTPIAVSTGEGSSVSDEHAEPEWTATPCWSSASRIGSARLRRRRDTAGSAACHHRSVRRRARSRGPEPRYRSVFVGRGPQPRRPPRRTRRRIRPMPAGSRCHRAARAPGRRRAAAAVSASRGERAARPRRADRRACARSPSRGRRRNAPGCARLPRTRRRARARGAPATPHRRPRRAARCRPRGSRAGRSPTPCRRDRVKHGIGVEPALTVDAHDRDVGRGARSRRGRSSARPPS